MVSLIPIARERYALPLVTREVTRNGHSYRYRYPVARRRLERPSACRSDRVFIETWLQGLDDFDLPYIPIRIDYGGQIDLALRTDLTRGIRASRRQLSDHHRWHDIATNVIYLLRFDQGRR